MTECIWNTFGILTFKLIETQWKLKKNKKRKQHQALNTLMSMINDHGTETQNLPSPTTQRKSLGRYRISQCHVDLLLTTFLVA